MGQTEAEKAKEIVEKYMFKVLNYDGSGQNSYKGKQCALIEVNAIIEVLYSLKFGNALSEEIEYYENVKQELINLK